MESDHLVNSKSRVPASRAAFKTAVARTRVRAHSGMTGERVSSGVARLDAMLGGGYCRGSSVLITGAPGTERLALGGAFAEAACRSGERTLFVSCDADKHEVLRDLDATGIRLGRYAESGYLWMSSSRALTGSAETFLGCIKSLAKAHVARNIVIDALSLSPGPGNGSAAPGLLKHLIDWSTAAGITLLCSSAPIRFSRRRADDPAPAIQMPVDTWIRLDQRCTENGKRIRSLTITRSRVMADASRVCEVVLSDTGVTLADALAAGDPIPIGRSRPERQGAYR